MEKKYALSGVLKWSGVVLGIASSLSSCASIFDGRFLQRYVAKDQPQGDISYFVNNFSRYDIHKGKTPDGRDIFYFDPKGDDVKVVPPVGAERVEFPSELESYFGKKSLPGQIHEIKGEGDIVRGWVHEYNFIENISDARELYIRRDSPAKIELDFEALRVYNGGGNGGSSKGGSDGVGGGRSGSRR